MTYFFHFPIECANTPKIHGMEDTGQANNHLLNEEWSLGGISAAQRLSPRSPPIPPPFCLISFISFPVCQVYPLQVYFIFCH